MEKSVVGICIRDLRYGLKLFQYLSERYPDICDYRYFDSFPESLIKNSNSLKLVVDEAVFADNLSSSGLLIGDDNEIFVLTESSNTSDCQMSDGINHMRVVFLDKYQSAENICSEIVRN